MTFSSNWDRFRKQAKAAERIRVLTADEARKLKASARGEGPCWRRGGMQACLGKRCSCERQKPK